jgi:ATP/maltotriose-dependent transcriptional regulator MalT
MPFAVYAASYRARLLLATGRPVAARSALEEALARAAPQHLVHPLLNGIDTRAGRSLLAELARDPREHPFAAEVLGRLREPSRAAATQPASPDPTRSTAPAPLVQPLTARETEVLAQLALGGSYQDVAQALFVTENTVKTHVSALYRKLGVERRAAALRRARALDLL